MLDIILTSLAFVEMTEATAPPLTIIWLIPPGTENPFTYAANILINQMYPQLLPGFKGRVAGLLSLLVSYVNA